MKRVLTLNRYVLALCTSLGILALSGCISVSSSDRLEVSDFAFCVNKMQEGGKAPDAAATFCAEQFGAANRVDAEQIDSH
jgi:hypothetical protein|tara:strand:+ start:122 stop:361 length:240 start_codon:yes stop_codon:yes gene_type:complete